MAIFNSYVSLPEGIPVYPLNIHWIATLAAFPGYFPVNRMWFVEIFHQVTELHGVRCRWNTGFVVTAPVHPTWGVLAGALAVTGLRQALYRISTLETIKPISEQNAPSLDLTSFPEILHICFLSKDFCPCREWVFPQIFWASTSGQLNPSQEPFEDQVPREQLGAGR